MKFLNGIAATFLLALLHFSAWAQRPIPDFSSSALKCEGQSITFTSTSMPGSGIITKTHWSFGSGTPQDTATGLSASYTYSNYGTYFVTLTVTNSNGNDSTVVRGITINPSPVAMMQTDVPCFPEPVRLEDNSNVADGSIVDRLWSINGETGSTQTYFYNPSAVGTYSAILEVTSDKGCVNTVTKNIAITLKPTITFSPVGPITLCEGDFVTLTVSGAKDYQWSNGTNDSRNTIDSSGQYIVSGFNTPSCSTLDTIEVISVPKPIADAGEDVTIKIGEKTTLNGNGGANYSWTPAESLDDNFSATPEASPITNTSYILTVLDANGCTDKDTVIITVDPSAGISIHNMLTPNNDGMNDKWDLSNVPGIEDATIYVFNRWGWEVFKAENYQHNWRGTYKEEPLPDGSYLYIIDFKNNSNQLKGALEILRNTQK